VINKHKNNEKFLYVCSENQQDNDIVNWLKANECEFSLAFMYRTQSNDVKELLSSTDFDVICFFTPSGIRSLFDNLPKFKQNGTVIGAFGSNTLKAAEEFGLTLEIRAPQPQVPSMVAALDQFLAEKVSK
jgi:uroporphyrinogen-III synthase